MKKKRHKRHFQLLELMVAIFILMVCIAPTMQIFTSIFSAQQDISRENQKNHIVHLMHAKFTEHLYKRLVSFDDIKNKKDIILQDPDLVKLLEKSHFSCSGIYSIEKSYKPRGQDQPIEYLCKLEIKVVDKLKKKKSTDEHGEMYEYYIYIDTQPDEGECDEEDEEEETEEEDDDEDEDEEDEGEIEEE